jgi:DNA-binding winged helix-turn-helix (wHTH) protein
VAHPTYGQIPELVEHAGEVVTRPILLIQIWGLVLEMRLRRVDIHIRGLRRKLGVYADEYLETVFGVGYRSGQHLHPVLAMRWQKEPEFQKAFRTARRTAFAQTTARLQQMSSAAVATLGKVMVDQGAPASARVRAAECIINHAAKAVEMEEIEARVTELELAAGTQKRA